MFDSYDEIFEKRGDLYHKAMTLYPQVRREEFDNLIKLARIGHGDIICDVPSGGGYLRNFVNARAKIISVETSHAFAKLCKTNTASDVILTNLGRIPIKSNSVDRVLSLAGLHHIEDKLSFYSESHRILKSNGELLIADAWQGAMVSEFLDVFVNDHSLMGHKGAYLNENTQAEIENCGFDVAYSSNIKYHWRFSSLDDMLTYFELLFGIDKATQDQILDGITRYLGYIIINKEYYLNWELAFYKAIKR